MNKYTKLPDCLRGGGQKRPPKTDCQRMRGLEFIDQRHQHACPGLRTTHYGPYGHITKWINDGIDEKHVFNVRLMFFSLRAIDKYPFWRSIGQGGSTGIFSWSPALRAGS